MKLDCDLKNWLLQVYIFLSNLLLQMLHHRMHKLRCRRWLQHKSFYNIGPWFEVFPPPEMEWCLELIVCKKYFKKLDLKKSEADVILRCKSRTSLNRRK